LPAQQQELIDMTDWQSEQRARDERLVAGSKFAAGKMVAPHDTTALLEAVVRPNDRICLEGDNQKQADFLAACLAKANPKPAKPEPYRIRCWPETPGAGGEVEAAADGPLSRAPFRRALVL
jgi:Malonate decarboxylase, alpha subunit, transporter